MPKEKAVVTITAPRWAASRIRTALNSLAQPQQITKGSMLRKTILVYEAESEQAAYNITTIACQLGYRRTTVRWNIPKRMETEVPSRIAPPPWLKREY